MSAFFTQKAKGRNKKENHNTKLFLQIVLILAMCLGGVGKGWGQIITFEFSWLTGNEATANSNSNDINLSNSTISRGSGLTAAVNGDRFNATSWAATSIANAVSGSDYMEFTITPNAGFQFSVSSIVINLQRSGTGPRGIALRSSVDGFNSNLDAEKAITDNTTTQSFTFTFSQANSNMPVTYRMYMYAEADGGSGGPGDFAGDDIIVNGTVTPDGPASPEINVKGNNTDISSGDITPSTTDHTDFGSACITGGTVNRTFTIENVGTADLSLTDASPYVVLGGANASDFSIVSTPSSTIAGGNSTTFSVQFNPTAIGTRNATISIANDDVTGSEDPYTFGISGTGIDIPAQPGAITGNINVCASTTQSYSITNVPGATSYTWTLPSGWTGTSTTNTINTTAGVLGGNIIVTSNNSCGSSVQRMLAITVNPIPTTPTLNLSQNCGSADLSFTPVGGIDYYWQTTSTGTSTGNSENPRNVTSSGTYYLRAFNGSCWSTSAISFISVINDPITITSQPVDQTVSSPTSASFTVTANNAAGYQWQVYNTVTSTWEDLTNTAPYNGVTSSTLTLNPTDVSYNDLEYRCVLTGNSPCADLISNSVILTVNQGPCFAEGFESGLPTSYTNGSVNLSSGIWTGVRFIRNNQLTNVQSGSISLQLESSSGSQFTSPLISNVGTLNFWAKRSTGSGSALQVNISTDGSTWNSVPGSPFSLNTNMQNFIIPINMNNIYVQFYRTAVTVYIDDVEISCMPAVCSNDVELDQFLPTTGPAGTLVHIYGTNFSDVTNVLFGTEDAQTFTIVNDTLIIAEVPPGTTAADKITLETVTCAVNSINDFVLIDKDGTCGTIGSGTVTDVFISEVFDSEDGSLSYIEIFNGTLTTVNLSDYDVRIITGTSTIKDYALSGNILSGATHILRIGDGSSLCSLTLGNSYPEGNGFNGNDRVYLLKNGSAIDYVPNPNYGGGKQVGFNQYRIANSIHPRPSMTFYDDDWTTSNTESCAHLGVPPYVMNSNSIEINVHPGDVSCLSTLIFTVDADAVGAGANLADPVWKFNDPSSMNTWANVSDLPNTPYNLPVTVTGSGSNTITITGATSVLQNFQFYVEIKTAGSPQCVQASNVAQYSFDSKAIYQSKANGNWTDLNTWQMSDNIAGPWVAVCNYPTSATSDRVIIKNNVILDTDNKVDWLIVESGGTLELSENSQLAILNGNSGGADLQVMGVYLDRANSVNSIQFDDPAATWELGAAGSFIKTNTSGVASFRNNYHTGIANIPATANWIYRSNGDGNPAVVSSEMVYPNLIFENTTASHFYFNSANMILNGGIASTSYCRVKGDFRVGVTGSSSVTVYNNNISVNPMLVEGNIEVGVGSNLTNASFNGSVTSTYGHGTGYNLHGHLTVNGNFINNSNQTGILSFAGTSDQIISGSGTLDLEDVDINNTGGAVQVRKDFGIPGTLSFGSAAARLHVDTSDITLQSNFDRTANVGIIPGTNQISYGSGRFVVERYINSGNIGKSWQFLSTPTTGQTVRQSWQEDGDEPPGYGTWIVGPAGTGAGYDIQNSLTSLKSYDAGLQNWVSKDATTNALLEPRGYMVFIRGDRSAKLFSSPVTSTTLRSRGTLFAPGTNAPYTIPVSVADNFYAAGNPYASAISVTQFVSGNTSLNDGIIVWDPTLYGSYGVGGHQTITAATGNVVTPGGTSYYPAASEKDIQSGNAFFMNASGATTISFTENMKVSDNELLNKGPQIEQNIPMLSTMLFNGAGKIADGNRVVFDDQYTDGIDRWDARKYLNSGENFGLLRNGMSLVVETRSSVKSIDTLFYRMSNLTQGNYELRFGVQHISNPEGLQGILIDKFLQTETIIPLSDSSFVPFQTNSNAASRAADRFMLVFSKPAAPLPVRFVSIAANRVGNPAVEVHWKIELEEDMEDYVVEHSVNGTSFTDIGHVLPAAVSQYNFLHSQADAGQNFYRIRAISQNGLIQYSPVAAVQPLQQALGFSVYPNPLVGTDFQLNLQDMRPGKYQLQLINDIGQTVQQQEITISSANQIIPIRLQQKLAKGVYQLLLWNGEENRRGQVVVVN